VYCEQIISKELKALVDEELCSGQAKPSPSKACDEEEMEGEEEQGQVGVAKVRNSGHLQLALDI